MSGPLTCAEFEQGIKRHGILDQAIDDELASTQSQLVFERFKAHIRECAACLARAKVYVSEFAMPPSGLLP